MLLELVTVDSNIYNHDYFLSLQKHFLRRCKLHFLNRARICVSILVNANCDVYVICIVSLESYCYISLYEERDKPIEPWVLGIDV